MDKMALADRLEGYSNVFASETSIGVDLKAMAAALREMPEDKFANIVNPEFNLEGVLEAKEAKEDGEEAKVAPEEEAAVEKKAEEEPKEEAKNVTEKNTEDEQTETEKNASEFLNGWNKNASEAVLQYLVKDVVGMNKSICCDTKSHLDKIQMPDAEKKETLGVALKPEQAPDQSEKLDSDMVNKSHGSVKNASEDEHEEKEEKAIEKIEEGLEILKDVEEKEEKEDKEEKEAAKGSSDFIDKAIKAREREQVQERMQKAKGEKVKSEEKAASEISTFEAEGIEFEASMDEIEISADEQKKLSALFG